jgi:hypothetical protein
MEVKFYQDANKPLWDDMKHKICENIINYFSGEFKPTYRIHFDKMLYSIGWFVGYVEIWKGKTPRERRIRRIPFVAKVWDWGGVRHNYSDYRTHAGVHGLYGAGA